MSDSKRYEAGAAIIKRLFGVEPRPGTLPEAFRKLTVENLFGDVWSRPGLELRERSMLTIAALAVLGRNEELRLHLRGALNLGIPPSGSLI